MARRNISFDPEASMIISASELSDLALAQHVTIQSCETSFDSLLAMLDSETLACLLSGCVITPEIVVQVPWNGSHDGELRILSVDSETSFFKAKRIGPETRIEVIRQPKLRHQKLVSRHFWSEAVTKQYPGQDRALSHLIDIVFGQCELKTSVGIVVSGADSEQFVNIVAHCSGLPVHIVQMSAMFSSRPGHAEQQLRQSLQLACGLAPAVLVVQDLELLRNSSQAERLRLRLEQFLDDLQLERSEEDPVVVLAPVQGPVTALPSSLRRSLRFDHVVVMRHLDPEARSCIVSGLVGDRSNLEAIVAKTTGFSRAAGSGSRSTTSNAPWIAFDPQSSMIGFAPRNQP